MCLLLANPRFSYLCFFKTTQLEANQPIKKNINPSLDTREILWSDLFNATDGDGGWNPLHIRENVQLFDFCLSAEENGSDRFHAVMLGSVNVPP